VSEQRQDVVRRIILTAADADRMPAQTAEEGRAHSGSAGAAATDAGREGLDEGTRIRADEAGVLVSERQGMSGAGMTAGNAFHSSDESVVTEVEDEWSARSQSRIPNRRRSERK
jgi:hypothetical protein